MQLFSNTAESLFCYLRVSHTQLSKNNKRSNTSFLRQRTKSPLRTPSFHSWEEREVCRRGPVVSALTAGWNKPQLLQYRSFGRMCCVCEINGDTWMTLHSTPPSLTPSQTLRLLWISCLAEVNRDMRAGTAVSNCSQQPSAIAAYHTPKSVISPLLSSRPGIYEKVQRKMLSEMIASVQSKCLA